MALSWALCKSLTVFQTLYLRLEKTALICKANMSRGLIKVTYVFTCFLNEYDWERNLLQILRPERGNLSTLHTLEQHFYTSRVADSLLDT